MIYTVLFTILSLIIGFTTGWLASDKYKEFLYMTKHDFDTLFEQNPHPEIFDSSGKIDKGEYLSINFDLGYDTDNFDPEDIQEI